MHVNFSVLMYLIVQQAKELNKTRKRKKFFTASGDVTHWAWKQRKSMIGTIIGF